MTESRKQNLVRRIRHLLPNIEQDGHLTITRLIEELLEIIEKEDDNGTESD